MATDLPSTCGASMTHVGVSLPSTMTEHAPHSPLSQPCFTLQHPERRRTSMSESPGAQSNSLGWPLRVSWTSIIGNSASCPGLFDVEVQFPRFVAFIYLSLLQGYKDVKDVESIQWFTDVLRPTGSTV